MYYLDNILNSIVVILYQKQNLEWYIVKVKGLWIIQMLQVSSHFVRIRFCSINLAFPSATVI